MAPTRVRGCAGGLLRAGHLLVPAGLRLADASRGQNGPRKATSRRLITVRLRSKSCLAGGPDGPRTGRRAVVASRLRAPQQANVGSKTRAAGWVPLFCVRGQCPRRTSDPAMIKSWGEEAPGRV